MYEPELLESAYFNLKVVLDLIEFKGASDVIIANRVTDDLADSLGKVFTRDLFHED